MMVCVDLDDTIDSFPAEMRAIMTSLTACGHTVWVVTGTENPDPTETDCKEKQFLLTQLGFTRTTPAVHGQPGVSGQYDNIVVLPPPHPENKAQWLKDNGADLLIDNDKANAQAASDICLVLVPWQTRTPQKGTASP